jgi:predicted nucleic acid-binding protein
LERLFVDTSAWLAYANRADRHHEPVRAALRGFGGRLVTTNWIFDETVTLAKARLGHATALLAGDLLRDPDVADLVRVSGADERLAWDLFRQREDERYSFTDCTSFVVMRRLGIGTAATLDEDFAREGFLVVPAR